MTENNSAKNSKNIVWKLISLLFIAVIFGVFIALKLFESWEPQETYKVLKVIEGDKFVIDINKNGVQDEDEIFHLNFVNSFPTKYSHKTSEYAKKFGFSTSEIISLGYGAKEFSRHTLEGKFVSLPDYPDDIEDFNPEYNYRFARVFLGGADYSKILLQNGFGFSYNPQNYDYYKKFENYERIAQNLKNLTALEIMNVDLDNKIYHELDCPNVLKIKNSQLMPLKEIPEGFTKCRYCYLKRDFEMELERLILKIESPNPNLQVGEIELFLINPNNYFAPTNRCRTNACQALLKNINSAKSEIAFAVYGFEGQDEIFEALKAAKNRGIKVLGVIDSDTKGTYAYPDSAKFLKEFSLVEDKKSALMHNKFFIFDNQKVYTGTLNISKSGAGGYNSNTVVVINSSEIANVYRVELEQMLKDKFQKKKTAMPATTFNLQGGTKVSVYFSPKGDVYSNVLKPLIEGAKNEILVSAFYLTHKEIIEDLINAKNRGVKIKVIIDASSATNAASKHETLRKNGILTKVENWGGKNHEKNLLVDGKFLCTGSTNFSQSGVNKNDENLLVIESQQVAKAYQEHFMRLYNSIDDKYSKTNPRAEGFESGNSCFDGIDNDFDGKIDSQDEGCKRKVLI